MRRACGEGVRALKRSSIIPAPLSPRGEGLGVRGSCGLILGILGFLAFGCSNDSAFETPTAASVKSAALERAERRLYDGAPPVIPHMPLGAPCVSCHNERGMAVEGLGFAPPSPHEATAGMSSVSRCEQCHVFQRTEEKDAVFVANRFEGLKQDLRRGTRLYDGAPPVMPHGTLMRENCQACHTGEAAREEIRTSHPERPRCGQCHVPQVQKTHEIPPFPAPSL